jgi:hypothetical protein
MLFPGDYWTADEAKHWSVRVDAFFPAIEEGNYAGTNLVGHPGVTTMWLGTLGIFAKDALVEAGWLSPAPPTYPDADHTFLYRYFLRIPIAIVTSLTIALAYLLMRRLFGKDVALIAAVLWAGEPFIVAHSKVLHVDALLTSFIALSLLTALVAYRFDTFVKPAASTSPNPPESSPSTPRVRWVMLGVSGALGGLALLTKSPSMILIPMVGLIGVIGIFRRWMWSRSLLTTYLLSLVVWGGTAVVVWVALWPAAWVDPLGAAWTIFNEIFRNGAEPHGWGNYFLGRPTPTPGLRFYPVALLFRLTPWMTVGLFLAGLWAIAAIRENLPKWRTRTYGVHDSPFYLSGLSMLLVFALLFTAMMSIPPKKFDRYLLPIFPVLTIVAAQGFLWLAGHIRRWWATRHPNRPRPLVWATRAVWIVVPTLLLWHISLYHPYELGYFNPLVGGGKAAQQTLYVGWGEGLEQAGRYITSQYNGCDRGVASWYEYVIQPYVCTPVLHQGYAAVPGHVDYTVLYINQVQRQIKPEIMPHLRRRGALVHTVTIHDIDYAQVYQLRQPRQYEMAADFGPSIRLTGYDVHTGTVRSSGILTLTLQWQALQEMDTDYALFIHAFDESGTIVGQADVPPGGPDQPTSQWGKNRFIDWIHRLPIDPAVAGERLWVTIGIYHPKDFARLPVAVRSFPEAYRFDLSDLSALSDPFNLFKPSDPSDMPTAPDDGEGALVLYPISLPSAPSSAP